VPRLTATPLLQDMKPLPSVYYPEFIAANQSERANNVINTGEKQKDLEKIRKDIRDFKVRQRCGKRFSFVPLTEEASEWSFLHRQMVVNNVWLRIQTG
jgi:hypothetical protein